MYAHEYGLGFPQPSGVYPAGTVKQLALGHLVDAVDPFFGAGRLQYVQCQQTASILTGTLVQGDINGIITPLGVAGNTGAPFGVVVQDFINSSVAFPTYGWLLVYGNVPIVYSVPATVGPMFGGTAGTASPTVTPGRQLLNAQCIGGGSTAIVKNGNSTSGSKIIQLTNIDGLFVGMAVSGTGIPGGAVITAINTLMQVVISSVATATGITPTTFTYTGYGLCKLFNSFVQGQIT